jgi:hypothetical protein
LIWIQLDLGAEMFAYSLQQQNRQSRPNPAFSSQQQPATKGKVTCFLICGMYREWLDLARESTALSKVRDQLQAAAAEVDNVIFAGDINLDTARRSDVRYGHRCLMLVHNNAVAESNMRYLEMGVMYRSHGQHVREDGEVRGHESVLDHICLTRDMEATVCVLSDATTDHSPVVASVLVNRVAPTTKSINRRNFKALERPALLRAFDLWPWSDMFQIRDKDKVLHFVTRGIVHGLDQAAPTKAITIKEGLLPLYLRPDTLALMAKRDSLGRGSRYKAARNKVTAMVRRDKEMLNLSKLSELGNSPTVLWEIANVEVGKQRQPLPALVKKANGTNTEGNLEAANVVNTYYVEKVRKIQAGRGVQKSTREVATKPRDGDTGEKIPTTFSFDFANAGRIAKVIAGLRSTPALGTDGIPVAVLKMGSDVLAGPISHLVNLSLSAGVFPSAFKRALIHPIYKGGGKARSKPASYRRCAPCPRCSRQWPRRTWRPS